jgi:predicted RecA/RadA family phage recombinase
MATNFIQPGNFLTISAPAAVASGGVVIAGGIVGVATGDAASGAPVDVAVTGVFKLPKVAANNIALGAAVHWDAAEGLATLDDDNGGNAKLGIAVEAAAASTGTVAVRLGTI